jgi:hypothetical protein
VDVLKIAEVKGKKKSKIDLIKGVAQEFKKTL